MQEHLWWAALEFSPNQTLWISLCENILCDIYTQPRQESVTPWGCLPLTFSQKENCMKSCTADCFSRPLVAILLTAIRIICSFCTIYHVYIYIVASTSVHECSKPGQNVRINQSCSINCLWSLNNWKCPFKLLLAFTKPKSNAAACS